VAGGEIGAVANEVSDEVFSAMGSFRLLAVPRADTPGHYRQQCHGH
jgi:hypothetical protein